MSTSHQKPLFIQLRAYSVPELACLYQVCDRTFKKWVKPFADEIGPRAGRLYNVNQVKIIFSRLGMPETIPAEPNITPQNLEKSGTTRNNPT